MVRLEFLEEKKPHLLSHMQQQAAQALAWQQQQAASADQLLEKWAAQGQTGRAGEAGTGGEWARPAPWGEPVPFRGKDSVSNWFCPRHFCSRKITV